MLYVRSQYAIVRFISITLSFCTFPLSKRHQGNLAHSPEVFHLPHWDESTARSCFHLEFSFAVQCAFYAYLNWLYDWSQICFDADLNCCNMLAPGRLPPACLELTMLACASPIACALIEAHFIHIVGRVTWNC